VLETSGRQESGGLSDCKALVLVTYFGCLAVLCHARSPFPGFSKGYPPGGILGGSQMVAIR
jgi:hypothetical protein